MSKPESLTINIMSKDYRVACPADEVESLKASARLLNEKLLEIKSQGSVIGTERIAIMAALNMSHEILHGESLKQEHSETNQRIDALSSHIESSMRNIRLA